MNVEAHDFRERAESKARDEGHRKLLLRVINNYDVQVTSMKREQFADWHAARELAAEIKRQALQALPELLEQFEDNATQNGARVLWARDAEEARRQVLEILKAKQAKRVVKSKSMTSEEIELNELLEQHHIEAVESDLGELIVQLAHERPYHIVTPAMHKTRQDISKLFTKELGSQPSDDPAELTGFARDHLRSIYTSADVGITGGNFLIADQGAIAITENEGNARLSVSCPATHIAIVGIEKMLPRLEHLALFWPLLATSGTGQQLTCYSSVIRGPRRAGERGGPDEMIIILLDNGRSRLYADPALRDSLRCIRCGACFNACPVFRTAGGHSYNTVYGGPIGSVITPHLHSPEAFQHLSFASSLCGACSDSCPVCIDIHHLLLENRFRAVESRVVRGVWPWLLVAWALLFVSRRRLSYLRPFGRWLVRWLSFLVPRSHRAVARRLPKRTFADAWRAQQRSQSRGDWR